MAGMVRANHSLTKLDLDGNYELGKKGIQKQKAICDALKATETAPCRIVCGGAGDRPRCSSAASVMCV